MFIIGHHHIYIYTQSPRHIIESNSLLLYYYFQVYLFLFLGNLFWNLTGYISTIQGSMKWVRIRWFKYKINLVSSKMCRGMLVRILVFLLLISLFVGDLSSGSDKL